MRVTQGSRSVPANREPQLRALRDQIARLPDKDRAWTMLYLSIPDHLLFDEHAEQLFAMTDPIAERVRKIGGLTLHSIGQIARLQRVLDNDAEYVTPHDMLAELREDNKELLKHMRILHEVCDEHGDIASASLIENWVDETEQRVWFLFETGRRTEG